MSVAAVIDFSRLPAPDAIHPLSVEELNTAYVTRFKEAWAAARAVDPSLPMYDVEMLETDPAMIVGQAFAYLRLLDRARVNDAVRAVLAPTARGADLDNVAARVNIERLVVTEATGTSPAVMESDESLRRRYWLAFDRTAAGSADGYLYEAFTAWPALYDAKVVGRAIHGRRGDTDLVVTGPGGSTPTGPQLKLIRDAVNATDFKPEAVSVTVIPAKRNTYTVALAIDVPAGPDPSTVVEDARQRVQAATIARLKIGSELPAEAISGAAYGPNVIRVHRLQPLVDIPADPYAIPVCTGIQITANVKA